MRCVISVELEDNAEACTGSESDDSDEDVQKLEVEIVGDHWMIVAPNAQAQPPPWSGEAGKGRRLEPPGWATRFPACCRLVSDLVIATTEKLHKTEPVAKWIRHERQFAPFVRGDCLFKPCASLNCLLNGALNLANNEI